MSAELDKPKNLLILGIVLATVALVVTLLVLVSRYFSFQVREEVQVKVLSHPSAQLATLREEEQVKLTHYRWVDQKAGVVSIPLDKALDLTLADWPSRPAGAMVPPAPAPIAGAQ